MRFKKSTSWDKPLRDLAQLEKQLGSRGQYARKNPYKPQLVWWVERDGKVHSNEDTDSHANMASDLLGIRDPWAAYGEAINELGWVRGMTNLDGSRGYFNWAGSTLPTDRQRVAIAKLVKGSELVQWDRIVGRWTEDGDDLVRSGTGFPWSGARSNPPKDIDSDDVLGGECAVWALAAASGRSVPDVRRAFMDAGIDIWTEDGLAKGTTPERIRKMVQKLDLEKRITYIGYSYPMLIESKRRALYYTSRDHTSRFMYGVDPETFSRNQEVAEGFALGSVPSGANKATIGQVIRYARKNKLAAIVTTGKVRLALKGIEKLASGARIRHMTIKGTTHILGYSPSLGVYDSGVVIPESVAIERFKGSGSPISIGDWYRHGQEIPQSSRPALFWVYFKGE